MQSFKETRWYVVRVDLLGGLLQNSLLLLSHCNLKNDGVIKWMYCTTILEYLHPIKSPSESFKLIYSYTGATLLNSANTSADSTFKVEFSWDPELCVPRFYTAMDKKKKMKNFI